MIFALLNIAERHLLLQALLIKDSSLALSARAAAYKNMPAGTDHQISLNYLRRLV